MIFDMIWTHLDLIHMLITGVKPHQQRLPWFDMVMGLLPNCFQLQTCQQEEFNLNQNLLERNK